MLLLGDGPAVGVDAAGVFGCGGTVEKCRSLKIANTFSRLRPSGPAAFILRSTGVVLWRGFGGALVPQPRIFRPVPLSPPPSGVKQNENRNVY